jgi:hypothetical protein
VRVEAIGTGDRCCRFTRRLVAWQFSDNRDTATGIRAIGTLILALDKGELRVCRCPQK